MIIIMIIITVFHKEKFLYIRNYISLYENVKFLFKRMD